MRSVNDTYIFSFIVMSFSFVIFIITSCVMTKSKMQFLHLHILLDNICLMFFIAIVGAVGVAILLRNWL